MNKTNFGKILTCLLNHYKAFVVGILFCLIVFCLSNIFSGCTTLKVSAYDDTGIDAKNRMLLVSKDDKAGVIIKLACYPVENNIYEIRSIYYFSNWRDGWTEAMFSSTGKVIIKINDAKKSMKILSVEEPVTVIEAKNGAIRFQDTRLYEGRAVEQISNRWARVNAVCSWLKENELCIDDVEPLLIGKNKKNVESKNYPTVPEQFEEIISSGTLERDWEECRPMFILPFTLFDEKKVTEIQWKSVK